MGTNTYQRSLPAISFFGPKGAGKSVLMQAFLRTIGMSLSTLSHSGLGVRLRLDGNEVDVFDREFCEKLLPTMQMDFNIVEFGRVKLQGGYAQDVSARLHTLRVYDAAGGHFSILADPSIINRRALERVPVHGKSAAQEWIHLSRSIGIIVVLDPTKVVATIHELSPDEQARRHNGEGIIDATQFTYEEYSRLVAKLLDETWIQPKLPGHGLRWIAVCVTKIDTLAGGHRKLTPHELIFDYELFGPEMISVLNQFEEVYPKHWRLFALSSFGYDLDGYPNHDPHSQWLKSTSVPIHWDPVNAHEPFLWLFEEIEISQLATGLLKPFLQKAREDAYIHYLRRR